MGVTGGVRPAEPCGHRSAVRAHAHLAVVVELRGQIPRERQIDIQLLRHAIGAGLHRDRCLDRVQRGQLLVRSRAEADPKYFNDA